MAAQGATSVDDPLFHISNAYPEQFPISFTHKEFPTTAAVMKDVGVPFGCVVTPFMPLEDRSHVLKKMRKYTDNSSKIARCEGCAGYMNPYCDVTPQRWFCSLCGHRNSIARSHSRYRGTDPRLLPEVQHMLIDYKVAEHSAESRPFVHVLLVQESMPLDSLTAVVDALSGAISDVHPDIYLVLITFSNRLGVYRLSGSGGAISSNDHPVSNDSREDSSKSKKSIFMPTPPPVQHVHFTYPKSEQAAAAPFDMHGMNRYVPKEGEAVISATTVVAGRFKTSDLDDILATPQRPGDRGDTADLVADGRSILEGRDPAVDFEVCANENAYPTSDQKIIEPIMKIGEAINFWDACSRVGSCRLVFQQ